MANSSEEMSNKHRSARWAGAAREFWQKLRGPCGRQLSGVRFHIGNDREVGGLGR